MKKVDLLNLKGEKLKDIKLNEDIFGIEPNDKVLYDAIIFRYLCIQIDESLFFNLFFIYV